jgi:hypothetical protein
MFRRRKTLLERIGLRDRPRILRRKRRHVVADIARGAAAGAVATFAMDRVTTYLYGRAGTRVREREDTARGGRTAYETAAMRAARLMGRQLTRAEEKKYGTAIHWALGIGAGALYGALRPDGEDTSFLRGLRFATGFWLLMDETVTPALRLTPGPRAFPWQTHARGYAGHVAYGLAAEGASALLRRVL